MAPPCNVADVVNTRDIESFGRGVTNQHAWVIQQPANAHCKTSHVHREIPGGEGGETDSSKVRLETETVYFN